MYYNIIIDIFNSGLFYNDVKNDLILLYKTLLIYYHKK